jgi:hypothetical protein
MDGFFIIGVGLAGGFGGIQEYEVIQADDIDDASKYAWERACDLYEGYVGMHGLREMDQIMEEDEVEEEEAEQIYIDEREDWLDYSAEPFSKELENRLQYNYHYDNRYKDITG